jgi:hypothetical protein
MRFSFRNGQHDVQLQSLLTRPVTTPLQRIKQLLLVRQITQDHNVSLALHARDAIGITSAFKTAEMVCDRSLLNIHVRPILQQL